MLTDGSQACATVVAPAKAHVIEVNVKHLSGLSIEVPPRSSSLGGTTFIPSTDGDNRGCWIDSYYSPPATPFAQSEDEHNGARHISFKRKFDFPMPKRRLDLAMTSPPVSPTNFRPDSNAFGTQPPMSTIQAEIYKIQDSNVSTSDISDPQILSGDSVNEIIMGLEDMSYNFPSTMLVPDSPAISSIRHRKSSKTSIPPTQLQPPTPPTPPALGSPFSNNFPRDDKSIRRRQTTNFSRPPRPPSTATTKTYPPIRQTQEPFEAYQHHTYTTPPVPPASPSLLAPPTCLSLIIRIPTRITLRTYYRTHIPHLHPLSNRDDQSAEETTRYTILDCYRNSIKSS